jgi:hypothetical protein
MMTGVRPEAPQPELRTRVYSKQQAHEQERAFISPNRPTFEGGVSIA